MFAVVSAISSCVSGVARCDDQSVMRELAISSFVLVVLVVAVAVLVNRGTRE
ncbi:MAG: hypothetical protein ACXWQR_08185 [Ktedonobacterales bacterium]